MAQQEAPPTTFGLDLERMAGTVVRHVFSVPGRPVTSLPDGAFDASPNGQVLDFYLPPDSRSVPQAS